jgi:hypothetical protein
MVSATLAFIIVITKTPRKLNTAAIYTADCGPIALVETHVAIALGASVQPFTKITHKVNTTVISRAGLSINCFRNSAKEIVIEYLLSWIFYFTLQHNYTIVPKIAQIT